MPAHHSGSRRYPKPPAPGKRHKIVSAAHDVVRHEHAPARRPVAPARRSARFLMQNEAPISTDEETPRQVPVRRSEAAAALTGDGGSMSRRPRGGDLDACWSATAFDK